MFKAHVARGGLGATMDRHDTLCLYRSTLRIPSSTRGRCPSRMTARPASTSRTRSRRRFATFASGIDLEEIRGALTTFHPTPFQTPGRANTYEFRDFKVMIDYCHNPHAMAVVAPFLSAMKKTRLVGVLNAPGDRRLEDFEEIGRIAAPHFDHVILRDDEDLRGRKAGEVAQHIGDALVKHGMKRESVEFLRTETEAVKKAIAMAQKDDFIVIFADRITKVAAQVDFERQKEGRASS
jgi:cyanophycin synthetase